MADGRLHLTPAERHSTEDGVGNERGMLDTGPPVGRVVRPLEKLVRITLGLVVLVGRERRTSSSTRASRAEAGMSSCFSRSLISRESSMY
jgi:hypothetical protein